MQNSPEARVFSKRLSIGWTAFCAVFVFSQPLCGFLATAAKPFQRFDYALSEQTKMAASVVTNSYKNM